MLVSFCPPATDAGAGRQTRGGGKGAGRSDGQRKGQGSRGGIEAQPGVVGWCRANPAWVVDVAIPGPWNSISHLPGTRRGPVAMHACTRQQDDRRPQTAAAPGKSKRNLVAGLSRMSFRNRIGIRVRRQRWTGWMIEVLSLQMRRSRDQIQIRGRKLGAAVLTSSAIAPAVCILIIVVLHRSTLLERLPA